MKQTWQLSDIDERIDYFDFYSNYITVQKKKQNGALGLCPFHDDSKPSLSINLKTGQYRCFSCGEKGNAITFLKKHCNMQPKEAYEHMARLAGLDVEERPAEQTKKGATLKEYATYKKLPENFLDKLGLKDEKDEFGNYVAIPYYDENNSVSAVRKRISIQGNNGKNKFLWKPESKITLYGVWKLSEIRSLGYVILVEGESDTHTLLFYERPVLGVPGAAFFEDEWVKFLQNLKVYVVCEPGTSGQTFTKHICEICSKNEFKGELNVITLPGYKDPSELHIKGGGKENFNAVLDAAIEIAKPLKMVKVIFPGASFQPIISEKWKCNLSGIHTYIKSSTEEMELVKISSTPMVISCNLPDIHSDEERLELSFYKREQWHRKIFERSLILTNTRITILANYGIDVTSENAKTLVRYLSMLMRENIDRIPTVKTTNRLGWTVNRAFVPGHAEDIKIDAETENFEHILKGFTAAGTFEDFKEVLKIARSSTIARFTVAASFASPLLKLLDHRIFMVYLYGSSTGGKSAALSAATSVWGNPNIIMQSFNTTNVALGITAGFYQHLPICIDEKQVADTRQEVLERIVYALSGGKDKARGRKEGGLREQKTWQNVWIANGEVPYSTDSSGAGVKTRLLEIYSVKAFKDEAEAEKLHILSQRYYGTAGIEFIGKLKDALETDPKMLYKVMDFYFKGLEPHAKHNIRAHLSATAVICAADHLYSIWLLGKDEKEAAIEAADMGKFILANLDTLDEIDYSERGLSFIASWVAANKDRFRNTCRDTQYGFIDDKKRLCIAYQQLKEACIKEGFSTERLLKDLAAREKIEISKREDGRIRYDVAKRMNGVPIRMIVFAEDFLDAGLFSGEILC